MCKANLEEIETQGTTVGDEEAEEEAEKVEE